MAVIDNTMYYNRLSRLPQPNSIQQNTQWIIVRPRQVYTVSSTHQSCNGLYKAHATRLMLVTDLQAIK